MVDIPGRRQHCDSYSNYMEIENNFALVFRTLINVENEKVDEKQSDDYDYGENYIVRSVKAYYYGDNGSEEIK